MMAAMPAYHGMWVGDRRSRPPRDWLKMPVAMARTRMKATRYQVAFSRMVAVWYSRQLATARPTLLRRMVLLLSQFSIVRLRNIMLC